MFLRFIGDDKKAKNTDKENNGGIDVEQYFHIHLAKYDSRKGNPSIFSYYELIYMNLESRLFAVCDWSKQYLSHFVESYLIAV